MAATRNSQPAETYKTTLPTHRGMANDANSRGNSIATLAMLSSFVAKAIGIIESVVSMNSTMPKLEQTANDYGYYCAAKPEKRNQGLPERPFV